MGLSRPERAQTEGPSLAARSGQALADGIRPVTCRRLADAIRHRPPLLAEMPVPAP